MTDLSELLLKYFLTSLNLIEVEPRGNAEETNNKEVMKMLNEGYIPLFSAEKIKFIKNLSPVYAQLKDMADAIFNELNIRTELPASYKVAIALQLSILETWRKVIVEKAMLDERIVIDEENKLDISPYALLLLYRFIAISKFMCTGNEIVKLFSKVLETQKEDNAIVDIKRLEEYIEKKRQDRNEQRRAYTMYNTLFAPLILSYALSGASLLKYYRGLTQNQLSYTSTTLMEILESYFFRVIYDDNRSTLISLAKELVDYFSVLHEIVSNKELKSIIKEGSLYSYVLSKANERGITDMSKISVIWGLINDAVIAALVSLELYDNEELKTAYRNLVGDITIYEYVIKYPQKKQIISLDDLLTRLESNFSTVLLKLFAFQIEKQINPNKPPKLLFNKSAGVGLLEGKNIWRNSTVNDKPKLTKITKRICNVIFLIDFWHKLPKLQPTGRNNKILLTWSWKELELLKLAISSVIENFTIFEKSNG